MAARSVLYFLVGLLMVLEPLPAWQTEDKSPVDQKGIEEFEKLQEGYRQAVYREVWGKQDQAVKELDRKYGETLDAATAEATKAGNVDTLATLRNEKKNQQGGVPLPDDDAGIPSALRDLRVKYRSGLAAIQSSSASIKKEMDGRYATALAGLETKLTSAGAAVAAAEVKAAITELGSVAIAPAAKGAAEKGRGPSQANEEVSMANLVGRRFAYSTVAKDPRRFCVMTFLPDGKLRNNSYPPNESAWKIDDKGHLEFIGADGTVTTIFTEVKWSKGKFEFMGKFHDGMAVHALREITELRRSAGLLTAARLVKTQFQFATVVPDVREYQTIKFNKKGGVDGASFDANATWKIDSNGSLVILTYSGSVFAVFDSFYTFEKGEFMVLEGSPKDQPGKTYQLMENRAGP